MALPSIQLGELLIWNDNSVTKSYPLLNVLWESNPDRCRNRNRTPFAWFHKKTV